MHRHGPLRSDDEEGPHKLVERQREGEQYGRNDRGTDQRQRYAPEDGERHRTKIHRRLLDRAVEAHEPRIERQKREWQYPSDVDDESRRKQTEPYAGETEEDEHDD